MDDQFTLDSMTKRITISLPDSTYKKLEEWAETEDRSVAGQASYVLQKAVDDAEQLGKISPNSPKSPQGRS
jgi:hypothetical protein